MIEFKNVSKTYPNGTKALKNVDLTINDGEFVFIVGHSGAGKTTLTKLIFREERITSGTLRVNNFQLGTMPQRKVPYLRRTLGIVFQDFRLFPNLTAAENIAFSMHVVGKPKRTIKMRVAKFLKLVNLDNKGNSFPSELSGGEQQRVALARALINNPNIIIADEPTGNIDPVMSMEMMELLLKINELGKTVIVITHDLALVNHFKKRVVTFNDGVIIDDKIGGAPDAN